MHFLTNQRNKLKRKYKKYKSNFSNVKCEYLNIERQIAQLEEEEYRNKILEILNKNASNYHNININDIWTALDKINPKFQIPVSSAKLDHQNKLVTDQAELRKLLAREYKERLRSRPVRPDLQHIKDLRKDIFCKVMSKVKNVKSRDFNTKDLDKALSELKLKKSRDPDGLINDIFKPNIIGHNLKMSLLQMFNGLKNSSELPMFMLKSNITTIPKGGNKSKLKLRNQRGVNRTGVIRSIYMRMLYNINYQKIDSNLSDGQMGGRKGKGCRNNLFVINGIIFDILRSSNANPVLIQIVDYALMFDVMDLEQALLDLYEAGVMDDTLYQLYVANKEMFIAVKTPEGLTDRQTVTSTVLQGETWASLLAGVEVDSISKDCMKEGLYYKYMNELPISNLAIIDDILSLTEPGYMAAKMNSFINIKTAEKGLQFGPLKCKYMVVKKQGQFNLSGSLKVDKWSEGYISQSEDYSLIEYYDKEVNIQKVNEWKYLGFQISNSGNNLANIRALKNKSIGVVRKIFQKLKSFKLNKYYFECVILFKNSILRPTLLYACETYYDLVESEVRQLERIEESYLRLAFNTSRSCPISQLYLETNQYPLRFEIMKYRILFLKYICSQNEDSILRKFINLQLSRPIKGDFPSVIKRDLKYLNMDISFNEIKEMKLSTIKSALKNAIHKRAFSYLMSKQKSKGKDIKYFSLQMEDYLKPNAFIQTKEDQQMLFNLRNKMFKLEGLIIENQVKVCICERRQNIQHLYYCRTINPTIPSDEYELIYNGNLKQKMNILNRIKQNIEKEQNLKSTQVSNKL